LEINLPQPSWEFAPFVTQDNKYMFFSRGGATMPTYSTYWVKIDNIIDSLRHTNFIPYLKNQLPNRTDSVGVQFNFTVPDSTFVDDDGNNTLTYSASSGDGSALPSWLNFNPQARTFSGNPATAGISTIKVIVTDNDSAKASCTFNIEVTPHTSIHQMNKNMIDDYKLFQNFPNPFNPSTVISYSLPGNSFVSVRIYNILGKEMATLVNSVQRRGTYAITLNTNDMNLSSGIYLYSLMASESNSNKVFKECKLMNYIK
jgi:hypothetical protein